MSPNRSTFPHLARGAGNPSARNPASRHAMSTWRPPCSEASEPAAPSRECVADHTMTRRRCDADRTFVDHDDRFLARPDRPGHPGRPRPGGSPAEKPSGLLPGARRLAVGRGPAVRQCQSPDRERVRRPALQPSKKAAPHSMLAVSPSASSFAIVLANERDAQARGRCRLDPESRRPCDPLGDLGAGKTTFARAMIRALVEDPRLEAPSPTFTLMQVYEGAGNRVVHADFYRLENTGELEGLGWEEATDDAIVLVEWAERAREALSPDRLEVRLSFVDGDNREARRFTISGYGGFVSRLASFKALRELLRKAGWADAKRRFLQGDASTRAYERLEKQNGQRAILMISPARPDGPPIRFGKSYSAIARLAENVVPFVAMSQGLRGLGPLRAGSLRQGSRRRPADHRGPWRRGRRRRERPDRRALSRSGGRARLLHAQRLPDAIRGRRRRRLSHPAL